MKKGVKKAVKICGITSAALFAVYFWNLDQKFMALLYKNMNTVFDKKKADVHL